MEIFKDVDIDGDASAKVTTDKAEYNYQCTPGHPYIKYQTSQENIDKCIGARITDIKCEGYMLQIYTDSGAITIFAEDAHKENIEWSGDVFPKITII